MAKERLEVFSSRWGLLVSMIGIAIGTGNIWRFPRIAAKYEGGAFLIPWLLFLLLWSLPIILMEYAIGKGTRMGPIGAFAKLLGRSATWMGAFVTFVTAAIMFYYSVVTGWCLRYLLWALYGNLSGLDPDASVRLWNQFLYGYEPLVFHFLALLIGCLIVYRGVVHGIERANRVFVPFLFALLVVLTLRAVTLPGALSGIESFFTIRWTTLWDYRVWLDALTQNAWSTGAGWGLILTYAVYTRPDEDTNLNAAITGFANHSISLLAGMMIFATVFALVPDHASQVITEPGPMNTGLSFIWLPQLLSSLPGGTFFAAAFFLALFFAAMSSLISMIEMVVRVLEDAGVKRRRGILLVGGTGFLLGLPSALSPVFFLNQDWVWGLGLLVSGAFFTTAVLRFGVRTFRKGYVNGEGADVKIGPWYEAIVRWVIPVEVLALIGWWFWVAIQADPESWWHPFREESVGTCVFQWGLVVVVFLLFNRRIAARTLGDQ